MTEDELKAIEYRCEKATPGPWAWENDDSFGDDNRINSHATGEAVMLGLDGDIGCEDDDGIFIAHARTDIPALTAEVRRLGKYEPPKCRVCGKDTSPRRRSEYFCPYCEANK